ncbi:MAG: nitroreductase family protein [Sulfuritalea sp.]|nr:nitroreductase family protein [Sulfuritalea sp.]
MQKSRSEETVAVHAPLDFLRYPVPQMQDRAQRFYEEIKRRRTVREFSAEPVPIDVIENAIRAAGTAPSGANQQPWHFAVIQSADKKRAIRVAAEEEERTFYAGRAPGEWLAALAPLGTDEHKPFLEEAPVLIAVFAIKSGTRPDGSVVKHYYVPESVGIASGFLLTALHHAGLATLTHTPSPMGFLNSICGRPEWERPVILVVAGYPKVGCQVPVHGGIKKSLDQISSWL